MADKKPHRRDRAPLSGQGTPSATPSFLGASNNGRATKLEQPKPRRTAKRRPRLSPKVIAVVLAVIVALAVCGAVALVVLSNTSAFAISSIDAQATEHVSSEDIATLAGVPTGTTLLNYDEEQIVSNLKRNPWIADVQVQRSYPDKLKITVTERDVRALVMMNAGAVVWCLGNDDVWIEPLKVKPADGQSMTEATLARAREMGALLITDVSQSVEPVAGAPADDEVFSALSAYHDQLSEQFWADIVSFSAPSDESISCILTNGVEVSLGSPTSIDTKEAVISQLLAKYPNRLTYINVRVPSNPSYRMVDTETVQEGTGALGDVNQTGTAPTGDAEAGEGSTDNGQGSESGDGASGTGDTTDGEDATSGEGYYGDESWDDGEYWGDDEYAEGGGDEYWGDDEYSDDYYDDASLDYDETVWEG